MFDAGGFDLIRLNHVLEHLNDPVKYLAMIKDWLAPGGVIYVEVPNIEEDCRVKSRGNLFHYGHIWNFNPWTLRAVAGLAGFEELDATRKRSAGTTGVVFRAGPVRAAAGFVNPENAARVRGLLARHYAGGFRQGKAVKPLVNLAARIEEVLSSLFAGTPREIGEKAVRSIRAYKTYIPEGFQLHSSLNLDHLCVHYEMKEFLIYWRDLADLIDATIPAAKELIKNESFDSDEFFKVDVKTDSENSSSVSVPVLIDVYGAPPTIKMIHMEDERLEIVWEDSLLQTSTTIGGAWEDDAFDECFLRRLPSFFV